MTSKKRENLIQIEKNKAKNEDHVEQDMRKEKNRERANERECERDRERERDVFLQKKCPDVTSSEGVRPRGSTLINKVTQR